MGGDSARRAWRTRALTLMALLAGAAGWQAGDTPAAEDGATLEHRVKAAFLYKIAGYVEWPAGASPKADTPFTIGVLGAEALAAELSRTVQGRTAHNRPITVAQVKPGGPLEGLHVLFVGREQRNRLKDVVAKTRPHPVLVVTEWDGALAEGGMVNFVLVDGRVRFEVALEAARRAGLTLSSRLLAVAQQVYSGTP